MYGYENVTKYLLSCPAYKHAEAITVVEQDFVWFQQASQRLLHHTVLVSITLWVD